MSAGFGLSHFNEVNVGLGKSACEFSEIGDLVYAPLESTVYVGQLPEYAVRGASKSSRNIETRASVAHYPVNHSGRVRIR